MRESQPHCTPESGLSKSGVSGKAGGRRESAPGKSVHAINGSLGGRLRANVDPAQSPPPPRHRPVLAATGQAAGRRPGHCAPGCCGGSEGGGKPVTPGERTVPKAIQAHKGAIL